MLNSLKFLIYLLLLFIAITVCWADVSAQNKQHFLDEKICRLPVEVGSKKGFIDCNGKIAIPAIFRGVNEFSEKRAIVSPEDGGKAIIDTSGKLLKRLPYDDVEPIHEGRGIVRSGNLYGIIDADGNEILSPKYEFIRDFSGDLAAFLENGKVGYLDKDGNIAITAKYNDSRYSKSPRGTQFHSGLFDFSEGIAVVNINGRYGYIDSSGKVTIPAEYPLARGFSNGLAAVRSDGKIGYIDQSGKFLIAAKYERAGNFKEGLALVGINKKYNFINKNGEYISDTYYETACNFNEGFACAQKDRRNGLINEKGKLIAPFDFDVIYTFHNGFVFAKKGQFNYMIDSLGRILVESHLLHPYPLHTQVPGVSRGRACNTEVYINRDQEIIWPDNLGLRCSKNIYNSADFSNFCGSGYLTEYDRKVICGLSPESNSR